MIEKHFTLKRSDGGVDSAFSLEDDEMPLLVRETENAWLARGLVHYGPTDAERASLQFRRSLYIVQDLKMGDLITKENCRAIRPGRGLSPKFYDRLLGKRIQKDVKKGTPVSWHLFE